MQSMSKPATVYLGSDAGADIAELVFAALRLARTALHNPDRRELAGLAAALEHDAWRVSLRCTDAETPIDPTAVAAVLTATLPAGVLAALREEAAR